MTEQRTPPQMALEGLEKDGRRGRKPLGPGAWPSLLCLDEILSFSKGINKGISKAPSKDRLVTFHGASGIAFLDGSLIGRTGRCPEECPMMEGGMGR